MSPSRTDYPPSRPHADGLQSNGHLWHIRLVTLLVFLLLLITTGLVIAQYERHWKKEQQLLLATVATSQAMVLERRLNNSLISAYILGQQVRYENGELANFPAFASSLLRHLGGITSLQLAPDGIITSIYPPNPHHSPALGLDLLTADSSRDVALLARETRELVMAGPFPLIQGGTGLSGRYPIYLGEGEESRFWGFSSAIITLDEFLADTELETLAEQGYRYQLRHSAPDGQLRVFAGFREGQLPGLTATRTISLPSQEWYLDVAFLKPPPHMPGRYKALIAGAAGSLLTSVLLFQLLLAPEKLRLEVHRKTAQLESLAYYDPLTGLANRKLFMEQLEQATYTSKRSGHGFALMFIDLDDFKHINDTLGHTTGDALLKKIAQNLREALRESDIVARLGGDEFTVLSHDIDNEHQALTIAEKLLTSLSTSVTLGPHEITASGSIGITLFPNDGEHSSELMQNADLAMYKAKAEGRNNFQFFSTELRQQARHRVQLEAELRRALQDHQFHLVYQPMVCLKTATVMGVEALVRWRHPDHGLIPPSTFIPVAEDSGLITTLGNWVIQRACEELAPLNRLRSGTPLQLALNLSPLQLHHRSLLTTLEEALVRSGLSAEQLIFEVTESTVMDRLDESLTVLNNIRHLGSRVAIDDFGTGYSSLNMLKQLPVTSVKVDRSFVRDIDTDGDDREIVAAIISIGHRLGLTVVGEGVETQAQLQFLCLNDCDTAQGYLFSHPLPVGQLAEGIASIEPGLPAMLAKLRSGRLHAS